MNSQLIWIDQKEFRFFARYQSTQEHLRNKLLLIYTLALVVCRLLTDSSPYVDKDKFVSSVFCTSGKRERHEATAEQILSGWWFAVSDAEVFNKSSNAATTLSASLLCWEWSTTQIIYAQWGSVVITPTLHIWWRKTDRLRYTGVTALSKWSDKCTD